jgi:hypothetical protein
MTRLIAWKWFAAVSALSWAVFGLLWAQVIALPNPFLPPRFFIELLGEVPATTTPERFVVMIFKETSLLLCAFALLGLLLAALAHKSGARGSPLAAAALCAIALVVSLVPTAEARRAAASEGLSLSLPEYFAAPFSVADRPPETATYARPEGEELKLDIWRPPDHTAGNADIERGRPAVVVVHGGGWRSGNREEFPRWNAWLADKGYVVFDIDYRLSPPPSWQDAPGDVRCAVGWVKENSGRYGLDPERVALMGRSAGGHLALLTACRPAAGSGGNRIHRWQRSRPSTRPPTSPASPPWVTWAAWTVSWGAPRRRSPDVIVSLRPSTGWTPATRRHSSFTGATTR